MDLDSLDLPRDSEGFIILKKSYSTLYEKVNYLTKKKIIMDRIYEYDIRSANTSSLKQSGKIDHKMLDMLESLDKQARETAVGKMIRKDRKIYKIISTQIRRARENLFRENNLQDSDILAIKNDAVFVIGHKLRYTKFGHMEFRLKHQYTLYMNIEKVEFYYDKKNDRISISGVRDQVLEHPDHQKGMIKFFKKVFYYIAMDQLDELRSYLINFTHNYKSKQLPHEYYRELNSVNIYRTDMEVAEFVYNLEQAGDSDLDIINPVFNYMKYVLPLIQLYL